MHENTPLLCFFGHHKCATRWINRVLVQANYQLGFRFGHVAGPKRFPEGLANYVRNRALDQLSYTNADLQRIGELPELVGFHVIRDPRDVVTSAYFSHLKSHPTKVWPDLKPHREKLQGLAKEEGLHEELSFSAKNLGHMSTWNYEDPRILELRYEDLSAQPKESFVRIFEHLGLLDEESGPPQGALRLYGNRIVRRWSNQRRLPFRRSGITEAEIHAIVDSFDFKKLAGGRKPGEVNENHHFRKGVAGDWRNHFQDDHVAAFKERYGDLPVRLGYETSPDWS